jgi:hypothetical protein
LFDIFSLRRLYALTAFSANPLRRNVMELMIELDESELDAVAGGLRRQEVENLKESEDVAQPIAVAEPIFAPISKFRGCMGMERLAQE